MDAIEQAIYSSVEGIEGSGSDEGDTYPGYEEGGEPTQGNEGQTAGVAAEGETAGATEVQTAPSAAKVQEVQDKLASELGINPKVYNRIPYTRVQEMVSKREARALDAFAKAFGIDEATRKNLKFDDLDMLFDTHYVKPWTESKTKITDYERRLEEVKAADDLIMNDPDRFLQFLALHNPVFREYTRGQQQQQVQQQARVAEEDQEPQPDYTDPTTGAKAFTVEGARKYFSWMAKQTMKEHAEEIERLRGELKPIAEREAARTRNAQADREIAKIIEDARANLEGFTEHEVEIAQLAIKERIDIEKAYYRVMKPIWRKAEEEAKKAGDEREKQGREKAIAEFQKAKPVTTAVTGASAETTTEPMKSLEDIIKSKAHEVYGSGRR